MSWGAYYSIKDKGNYIDTLFGYFSCTMKADFWTLLRKYCLESSILGLKYFYLYPDPISRCFWGFNLIVSLGMSCTLSLLLYWRFAEMPTRITIENQYEKLENLAYPAITICSPNQMTVSSMMYFNKSLVNGNLSINLETALPLLLGFDELIGEYDSDTLKHLQALLDINRYRTTEVMGRMAQSCDRFMKFCHFPNHPEMNCSSLFQPLLTTHGLCCAFNSMYHFNNNKRNEPKPDFTTQYPRGSGIMNALTVITDFEPADAMRRTLLNAGAIRVMYTEPQEFPADDDTTLLDPNGESFHLIRATHTYCSEEVIGLSASSRQCLFDYERDLQFFKRYRNSDCDHYCYARAVHEACGCWMLFLPSLPISRACNLTSIPCIMHVRRNMTWWLVDDSCDCPRDCESVQYMSDAVLGNLRALPHMYSDIYKGVNFTENTSVLNFVFAKPVYTKQRQETVISLTSLTSNLGGVFGLFLGCSWISLLEILFYIYLGVKNYIRDRLSRRTVAHSR